MGRPLASPLPSYGSHIQAPSRIQALVPVDAELDDADIDREAFLSAIGDKKYHIL
jgi:hypothetical protein